MNTQHNHQHRQTKLFVPSFIAFQMCLRIYLHSAIVQLSLSRLSAHHVRVWIFHFIRFNVLAFETVVDDVTAIVNGSQWMVVIVYNFLAPVESKLFMFSSVYCCWRNNSNFLIKNRFWTKLRQFSFRKVSIFVIFNESLYECVHCHCEPDIL